MGATTNTGVTDTQEKITMKDHDILIAVHTLQTEMMRRWDEYAKNNDARHEQTNRELGEISRDQIRVNGDITSLRGTLSNMDERIDRLEAKSLWMNVGGYIGVIIAGVIAWFKT